MIDALVDAHHHLWDAGLYNYPGLVRPGATVQRRYLLDDFLADAARWPLVKSVHLQGEIARDQSVAETEWLQQIADRHGFPHAIVAYAPLQDPRVDDVLVEHGRSRNLRGIRQILNPDQSERPDFLDDPAWQAGYGRLAEYGLSFDFQASPEQMPAAAAVARAHPHVPLIVNHTGMPRDRSAEGHALWRTGLRVLAELPHVCIKISGLATFDPNWSVDSIRPLVLETIDIFGPSRCMFASNFPVDKRNATFDAVFEAFDGVTADFSQSERSAMFHATAERVYRI